MTPAGSPPPPPDAVVIRPYQRTDRDAVRRLCCDTADRGHPIESFFDDRQVFADLLTRYYTECEPQSAWVAESGGRVVGYLTGCLDSRRRERIMRWRIMPAVCGTALLRGVASSVQAWRLAWAGLRTVAISGWPRGPSLAQYPAHLHINLARDVRGRAIGPALMDRFLSQARAHGARGVHATVRADNPAACRFFERMGFRAVGRYHVIFPRGRRYEAHDTVFYGKTL